MDISKFKLSLNDAKNRIDEIDNMNEFEFKDLVRHWSVYDVSSDNYNAIFESLRKEIVQIFKGVLEEQDYRISYMLDLKVGLRLYELLNPTNGFSIVSADDDDIWRYITINVFPDLTFIRYPNRIEDVYTIQETMNKLRYPNGVKTEDGGKHIKKKRFYSHTRRIWLKTLWWYIHLGWQGDSAKTFEVLKNNGTNIISHFIERPGRGYREGLFRSLIYAFYMLPEQKDDTFRAAAKLNLAKCVSFEPSLSSKGELDYSIGLFDEVIECEAENENVEENDTK